jgi:hypothetical protein
MIIHFRSIFQFVSERKDRMGISISTTLSAPLSGAPLARSSDATTQPGPETHADTVKLSQAAQVHLLKQQGQTLTQIASNLSIPITTVDGYLGIAAPKPASASTQQPEQIQGGSKKPPETPVRN